MPIQMPQVLEDYVQAVNDRDEAKFESLFTEDCAVQDEGGNHRGRAEVAKWLRDTVAKYQFTLEPQQIREEGAETIVTTKVTGDFPGSPLPLNFHYTLAGGKIARLRIRG